MFKDNLTDYNHGVWTRTINAVGEFFSRLIAKELPPTKILFDIWDLEIYKVEEIVYHTFRNDPEPKKITPLKWKILRPRFQNG